MEFQARHMELSAGGIGHVTAVRMYGNTSANPRLTDPVQHDYAPRADGPAAGWGIWNGRS